ncbi:toxin-antitoxin system HicB family antitoxin [Levilactobacillus brevis]|nr:toxin-antitoxin system HicB family antitoxin [Levilactobacillus brevis]
MDEDLFQRLSAAADADGRSINAYIVHLLSRSAPTGNWEQRQLIGRSLAGKELDPDSGLVLVAGIYYRYLLEPPEAPDERQLYHHRESREYLNAQKNLRGRSGCLELELCAKITKV